MCCLASPWLTLHFSSSSVGGNNRAVGGVNKLIYVKPLEQFLAHGKRGVFAIMSVQQRTSPKLELNEKVCGKHPERVVVSKDHESALTPNASEYSHFSWNREPPPRIKVKTRATKRRHYSTALGMS